MTHTLYSRKHVQNSKTLRSTVRDAIGERLYGQLSNKMPLMGLLLCVNFTSLRDVQRAGKHYLWVCQCGCFWNKLAFDSANWVKRSTLTNVGRHHPICLGPKWKVKERMHFFSPLDLENPFSPSFTSAIIRASGSQSSKIQDSYQQFPGSLAFELGLGVTPLTALVLRSSDSDWLTSLAFLVLQLIHSRWCEPIPVINLFPLPFPLPLSLSVSSLLSLIVSVFLENPHTTPKFMILFSIYFPFSLFSGGDLLCHFSRHMCIDIFKKTPYQFLKQFSFLPNPFIFFTFFFFLHVK